MDKYNSDEIFLSAIDPAIKYYFAEEVDKLLNKKTLIIDQKNILLDQQTQEIVKLATQKEALKTQLIDCEELVKSLKELVETKDCLIDSQDKIMEKRATEISDITRYMKKILNNIFRYRRNK